MAEVVKEGDTVRLSVLSVDPIARRMSFSMKQSAPDPWKTVHERYQTGSIVAGQITKVADFGAFVELEPGLEGLIHISELSDNRIRTAAEVAKPGQNVNVSIMEIDKDARRMSLSLKRAAGMKSVANAAAPAAAGPKKKRPELRGGLDFDFGMRRSEGSGHRRRGTVPQARMRPKWGTPT